MTAAQFKSMLGEEIINENLKEELHEIKSCVTYSKFEELTFKYSLHQMNIKCLDGYIEKKFRYEHYLSS